MTADEYYDAHLDELSVAECISGYCKHCKLAISASEERFQDAYGTMIHIGCARDFAEITISGMDEDEIADLFDFWRTDE